MADTHSTSIAHLPWWFAAGPGESDVLLIVMAAFLVAFVFMFGVLMLRLHHLPEHIAQKGQKIQYQLVATLGLLAMFTHYNLLWIAGLLLAMIDFPDFTGLLDGIAGSVKRIAWRGTSGSQTRTSLLDGVERV